MYCPECGKYNVEEARFCHFCGARLEENAGRYAQAQAGYNPSGQIMQQDGSSAPAIPERTVKKRKKKIWLILAALLLTAGAAAAAVFLWILPQQKEKEYKAHISDGDRYLEEMDYEKAEDSYLAAIDIEPKEPEPYMKLADIYEIQNQPEKVKDILKQGSTQTGDTQIRGRYNLWSYVDEVLIPQEGQCSEGEYTCEYKRVSMRTSLKPVSSEKGVLSWRIRDFDNDGEDELLVLILNNEYLEEYTQETKNEVLLRMYEAESEEVVLKDEMSVLCPVLGSGDSELSGIFLHENDGQTYICGSLRQQIYLYADGVTFDSFVLTYDGKKFEKEAGTDEAVSGSEFSGEKEAAEKMADYLEKIGLDSEAEQIRDSWMRCFEFTDDVEMLMLIEGENSDADKAMDYWETKNPEDLGEVTLTLKLSWDEERAAENDRDERIGQDAGKGQDKEKISQSAEKAYTAFLDKGEYDGYTSDWTAEAESYSILDINQDGVPELMVHSENDGFRWSNTLLFVYDSKSQEVKLAEDIYHYADIRYSDKHKAIVYSDVRSTQMYGGQGFFTLDGTTLTSAFSVGWDNTSGSEHYFIYENGSQKEISESESNAYYSELTEIEQTEL